MISMNQFKSYIKTFPFVQSLVGKRGALKFDKNYARMNDMYHYIVERDGIDHSEKKMRDELFLRPSIKKNHGRRWGDVHTFFVDDSGDYTKIHMLPALERAGRCSLVDWKSISGFVPIGNRSKWRGDLSQNINGIIKQIEFADQIEPIDLIFCSCGIGTLGNNMVKKLSELGIPMVSYWADDKQNFWEHMGGVPGNCPQVSSFDLCWTTSAPCVPWYVAEGGRAIAMPEGADPGTFYVDISDDFQHEVSFVGMKYGVRTECISYLKQRGVPIEAFGRGWGNSLLEWNEMANIFAQSKISLSFPWVGHSNSITTLKGRDFEATMAGGLYLTGFSEELARHYSINEEIFCYNSIEECVDLIRYLLARPDLCQRVRKKGQERSLKYHTWDARFKKLMSFMGLIEDSQGGK